MVLERVDHAIFKTLWQWARRRHPAKGRWWVTRRSFRPVGQRQSVFSIRRLDDRRQEWVTQLFQAASVPITRHVKIKGAAKSL